VGVLWIKTSESSERITAFGYDFEIREDLRRHGYGCTFMVAAEWECRELGVVSIGLNVFGHNLAALTHYEQMGFQVTGIQMNRKL